MCVTWYYSLTAGQWVRVADPDDPVDCNSNSASDPFLCTNVTSPKLLSIFILLRDYRKLKKAGTSVV